MQGSKDIAIFLAISTEFVSVFLPRRIVVAISFIEARFCAVGVTISHEITFSLSMLYLW